jgi:4-amino-4-deoxy-L-arabinose transferase-like glycosyltransferase
LEPPLPKRFSSLAAPPDRPLPLWILYPLFFVGLYLSHSSLLRMPFFWDEAGYYIPAALDFFRTGSLIPHSTLTNAHPPLPSILLAAWWRFAGFSVEGTRTLIEIVAAAALLGVFRLARLLAGNAAAIAATLLTALYPIWFTQSTLAHADIFAAAFTLWGLSFYFERNNANAVAALFSLAVLSKETAIVTPLALALYEAAILLRERPGQRSIRNLAALVFPVLPLALWYAYHRHMTGFVFGNPEFLRYNATANLGPARILISLWHRCIHLFFHMEMFVPVVCAFAVLPMARRAGYSSPALSRPVLRAVAVILAANAVAFSILGGALLTRYLLPMYPLILIVCVALWRERYQHWAALAVLSAAGFFIGLTINPPYSIAPEDNLTYRNFITLHQRAATILAREFPAATVLTAWPATAELVNPDLGYVRKPMKVTAIDNFSAEEIAKAAAEPGTYDTALVFSTKWIPPANLLTRRTQATDKAFFDLHEDLRPETIALALHGRVVWTATSHGEWAAILRFPRSNEAGLTLPGSLARHLVRPSVPLPSF